MTQSSGRFRCPTRRIPEFPDIFLRKTETGAMILGDGKFDRRLRAAQ
jgi:hypothetical protein